MFREERSELIGDVPEHTGWGADLNHLARCMFLDE